MKRSYIAGIICIITILLLAMTVLRPPVEGHYYCMLYSTLDGSRGYLVLSEGDIDLINENEGKINRTPSIGHYELQKNGATLITIDYGEELHSGEISVGWLGFQLSPKFGEGAPSDWCRAKREFRPWINQKLKSTRSLTSPTRQ